MTTVAQLIDFLKTQPQEMQVAYRLYSEYSELKCDEISRKVLQPARNDGWVHAARSDKPTQEWLVFPGN